MVLSELEVRPALPAELPQVAALLEEQHYLGGARQVGRTLVQIVHHHGRWAALLVWGPAALKLIDRDEWIGWTPQQRAERIGLVVQNRRFLVLAETRMPNLASRAMGLALRHLPAQWHEKHGYAPLLAETFTDIESFEGTCYKASNWQPCGLTKGFGRDTDRHRADFYREFQLKGNQPDALREAERIAATRPPFFACVTEERGHGRVEKRLTEVLPIEPQACGLPHVRTLVVTTKWVGSTSARVAKFAATGPGTINRHVGSLVPRAAARFARLIRGHWGGCEIRNHWVRDVLFEEDATRCKDLNGNLAVLRCALIALKSRHAASLSWPHVMERSGAKFTIPYNIICNNSLK